MSSSSMTSIMDNHEWIRDLPNLSLNLDTRHETRDNAHQVYQPKASWVTNIIQACLVPFSSITF